MESQHGHSGCWVCLWCCKQAIAEQLANLQQDATMKQRLRKIGNILLSHRQLSQQEAAFLVAGLYLKGSSCATVFVSAIPKGQRT